MSSGLPVNQSFYVKTALPEDEAIIRQLLREAPMHGAVHVSLQCEPNANLAAAIQGRKHDTVFVMNSSDDRLLGVGSRSVRSLYVNGKVRRVGYLSQLRARPGRNGLRRLRAGFDALERTRGDDEFVCDLTSIIEDNKAAVRMLERGLPGLPDYRLLARLTTFLIPASARAKKIRHAVESAGAEDLRRIVTRLQSYLSQYQFSPYWDERTLQDQGLCNNLSVEDFLVIRNRDLISACVAIWDQRNFKQVIINGYSRAVSNIRPLLNTLLFLLRKPRLPAAPSELNLAYLSHLAVEDNDPDKFTDLIHVARLAAAERGIDYLALGLTTGHPLHRALSESFPNYQYASKLYTVHWEKAAMIDHTGGRIPHLEVAVL